MTIDDKEKQQQREASTSKQYAAIGEFAVKFEQICFALHTTILFILHGEGLRNQQVGRAVLAGLTAEPLASTFAASVVEAKELDDDDKKVIKIALKRFKSLTERRNEIIHGSWFIGWASKGQTDFSEMRGLKQGRSQKGVTAKSLETTVEEFQEHIKESEDLAKIIWRLHGCFVGGFKVSDNFRWTPDNVLITPDMETHDTDEEILAPPLANKEDGQ